MLSRGTLQKNDFNSILPTVVLIQIIALVALATDLGVKVEPLPKSEVLCSL